MTCGSVTLRLDGDGFVVITGNRASSGFLKGAPPHMCRYNRPPEIEAEYVTPTAAAAMQLFEDAQTAAGLKKVRVRWGKNGPQLVRISVPSSDDYIDFWTVDREPVPAGAGPDFGNGYAKLGHPGIAADLRVAPPPGTTNLEICVFLEENGLEVLDSRTVT
jgi:hypothetical protein